MLIWIVFLACLLSGVALLVIGLRGTRVGDAPHCAACGFELTGLTDPDAPCPECGSPLGEGGVRIGCRTRKPRLAAFGGALGLVGLLPLAAGLVFLLTGASWASAVPAGVLIWSVRHGGGETVAQELISRRQSGELDAAQETAVIGAILDRQADRRQPWETKLGAFFESSAHATVDHRKRYFSNIFEFDLVVRERVGGGVPLQLKCAAGEGRSGEQQSSFWIHTRLTMDGEIPVGRFYASQPPRPCGFLRDFIDLYPGSSHTWFWHVHLDPLGGGAGREAVFRAEFAVTRARGAAAEVGDPYTMPAEPVEWVAVEKRVHVTEGTGVTLINEGKPPVDLSTRCDARITVRGLPLGGAGGTNVWVGHTLEIIGGELPTDPAHRLVLTLPDNEELIVAAVTGERVDPFGVDWLPDRSSRMISWGDQGFTLSFPLPSEIPHGTTAALRPDPMLAARIPGMEELDMRVYELGEVTVRRGP